MNLLDAGILVVLVLEAARGSHMGLVRSFFSLGGVWAGILLGSIIAPITSNWSDDSLTRVILLTSTIVIIALIGSVIGHSLGSKLSRYTRRLKFTAAFDHITGAAFSVTISMLLIWLLASVFGGMTPPGLNQQIRGSAVIRNIDETLPPAPTLLARLAGFIGPLGFPEVYVDHEPQPLDPVDATTAADIEQATKIAGASTVKIEGVGCGGLINGSGFVAADNLIITNAHVVAGITRPVVIDGNGTQRAEAVYFDPELDLAILRVDNPAGAPLPLATGPIARGTSAVAIGYPAGGPLRANAAGVLRRNEALGRDIYGQGLVARQIYQLQTQIESGNSGGPLVLPDGTVIGVVFARSQSTTQIGYALTSPAVKTALEASSKSPRVSTQQCAV